MAQLQAAQTDYVILESPLLFETDQHQLVDTHLLVDVPVELQLQRACARDNNDPTQIQRIIDAQMSRQDKRDKAEFVLDNSLDLETLPQRVLQLHQQFRRWLRKRLRTNHNDRAQPHNHCAMPHLQNQP